MITRTAYSYIRFSTLEQKKGRSMERQKEMAENYCKNHNLILDKTLTLNDTGISAFHGAHLRIGALGRFLAAAEAGKVVPDSFLLIENLDRLSRENIEEAFDVFKRILKLNINIVILTTQKIYTRESLKKTFDIMEALMDMDRSNSESERKSKLIADAWASKRKNTQKTGALLTHKFPAWLTYDDLKKKFIPIKPRVAVIKQIFELAGDGQGKTKIVKELHRRRIPAFKGRTWATSSVQRLLHNRELIGEYQPHRIEQGRRVPHGDPVQGYFPVVIAPETFHYIQIQTRHGTPLKGPRDTHKINNLFTGLISCGYCGSSMYFLDKGEGCEYVICSLAKKGAGCKYVSLRYDEFERSFLEFCRKEIDVPSLFNDKESRKLSATIVDLQKRIQGIESRISDNRSRLQKLMVQFAETENKELRHNYDTLLTSLTNEIETLTKGLADKKSELVKLRSVRDSLHDRLKSIADYGQEDRLKNDPELRARVRNSIRDIVDRIEVFPGGTMRMGPGRVIDFLQGKNGPPVEAETNKAQRQYSIRFKNGVGKMIFLNPTK
jgi:DNA invertase Pin-like site-specific DNA recombinase